MKINNSRSKQIDLTDDCIYFDNAATTWPKPIGVKESVIDFFDKSFGAAGRTFGNESAKLTERIRTKVATYFKLEPQDKLIFIPSATIGMNLVLKSILSRNDHVLTGNAEHHSVYRPLSEMESDGVHHEIIEYIDNCGAQYPSRIIERLNKNTKLVILNHASNVTGDIYNVEVIGAELRKRGILFLVDISQSAGIEEISLNKLNADILVAATHKHMYGLPGLGIVIFRENVNLKPLYYGGTGKNSEIMKQPTEYPINLEAGSPNIPALLSLEASLEFISHDNLVEINKHQHKLTSYFVSESRSIKSLKIYKSDDLLNTGTISFTLGELDPTYVIAPYLKERGNVHIRPGLHCAPQIHRTLKTFPSGTCRISFSYFNTMKDVETLVTLLKELAEEI